MSNISVFEEAKQSKEVIIKDGKVFASQKGMAIAFGVSIASVSGVINRAEKRADIDFSAVFSEKLNGSGASGVQIISFYPIEVITLVGFRLRKEGATAAFMSWSSKHLESLITTGIAVDEAILGRNPDKQRLLDEIWRKATFTEADVNSLLVHVIEEEDARVNATAMKHIYASVVDRARVAATGMTAAQIKLARCRYDKPNLGMTVVAKDGEKKPDPQTARNYLDARELEISFLVEQQFSIILRMRIMDGKRMKIVELIDTMDQIITLAMGSTPTLKEEAPAGLSAKAKLHVKNQVTMSKLLPEGIHA